MLVQALGVSHSRIGSIGTVLVTSVSELVKMERVNIQTPLTTELIQNRCKCPESLSTLTGCGYVQKRRGVCLPQSSPSQGPQTLNP